MFLVLIQECSKVVFWSLDNGNNYVGKYSIIFISVWWKDSIKWNLICSHMYIRTYYWCVIFLWGPVCSSLVNIRIYVRTQFCCCNVCFSFYLGTCHTIAISPYFIERLWLILPGWEICKYSTASTLQSIPISL